MCECSVYLYFLESMLKKFISNSNCLQFVWWKGANCVYCVGAPSFGWTKLKKSCKLHLIFGVLRQGKKLPSFIFPIVIWHKPCLLLQLSFDFMSARVKSKRFKMGKVWEVTSIVTLRKGNRRFKNDKARICFRWWVEPQDKKTANFKVNRRSLFTHDKEDCIYQSHMRLKVEKMF